MWVVLVGAGLVLMLGLVPVLLVLLAGLVVATMPVLANGMEVYQG